MRARARVDHGAVAAAQAAAYRTARALSLGGLDGLRHQREGDHPPTTIKAGASSTTDPADLPILFPREDFHLLLVSERALEEGGLAVGQRAVATLRVVPDFVNVGRPFKDGTTRYCGPATHGLAVAVRSVVAQATHLRPRPRPMGAPSLMRLAQSCLPLLDSLHANPVGVQLFAPPGYAPWDGASSGVTDTAVLFVRHDDRDAIASIVQSVQGPCAVGATCGVPVTQGLLVAGVNLALCVVPYLAGAAARDANGRPIRTMSWVPVLAGAHPIQNALWTAPIAATMAPVVGTDLPAAAFTAAPAPAWTSRRTRPRYPGGPRGRGRGRGLRPYRSGAAAPPATPPPPSAAAAPAAPPTTAPAAAPAAAASAAAPAAAHAVRSASAAAPTATTSAAATAAAAAASASPSARLADRITRPGAKKARHGSPDREWCVGLCHCLPAHRATWGPALCRSAVPPQPARRWLGGRPVRPLARTRLRAVRPPGCPSLC